MCAFACSVSDQHGLPSLAESYRYCHALTRRTAGNFYYSFLTLPRDRFRAMCVLYAFMRITDDLGDDAGSTAEKTEQLAAWRGQLQAACSGSSTTTHPVFPALADIIRQYRIPPDCLAAVITGVERDLQPVAFTTFAELEHYCYHVAGAVGLACIHIWGFHDRRAEAAAIACGTAFQLTNILRDLGEDAARGRVYLPAEDLQRFGYSAADLARGSRSGQFTALMRFQVARARSYYDQAAQLFPLLDPPGRPILEAMIRIYGGLLDEIERRQYDVFTRRVELRRWRKLRIAFGSILRHKLRRLWFRG